MDKSTISHKMIVITIPAAIVPFGVSSGFIVNSSCIGLMRTATWRHIPYQPLTPNACEWRLP